MIRSAAPSAPGDPSALRNELAGLITCPDDGARLQGWDGVPRNGTLICAVCGHGFPIEEGVPRLLPAALREAGPAPEREAEFTQKRSEMAARDAQVTLYDANLPLRLFSIPEIPLTLRYLSPEPDGLMLEGGCGTGRMTRAFAAHVRGLVCADLSLASLRAARAKLPPDLARRALFAQADLSHLPFPTEAFDRVGSFQVLEHLPTSDARARAVAEMARVLKGRTRGGRLALSAYRWGPPLSWSAQKQGHHSGGIPFFRATWEELSALVAPHLRVHKRTGALLYHFLLWGRKHLPPLPPGEGGNEVSGKHTITFESL